MAFPSSPTNGQKHTESGVTYIYVSSYGVWDIFDPNQELVAGDVLTKIKTVDGAGSGLDADTLDGLNSSQFMRGDATNNISASISTTGSVTAGNLYSRDIAGTITDGTNGKDENPFRLSIDANAYMMTTSGNTWGLFWAGNSNAFYGTNGQGGPGNIWNNSSNPNEFVFVGSDQTRWSVHGNTGNTWQGGTLTAVGNITTSGEVISNSDIRLKTDIKPIESALDTVKSLSGKSYVKSGNKSIGLIAQEVEKVLPDLVYTAEDEMKTKSVAYGNIVAVLIEAIKEQQKQIEELKEKLDV